MSHFSGLILCSGLHPEDSPNRFQPEAASCALQMLLVCSMRLRVPLLHHVGATPGLLIASVSP